MVQPHGGEQWGQEGARGRLCRIADRIPIKVPADPHFLQSGSNDVWSFNDHILRVCWNGDRSRLLREAELGRVLPDFVRYPRIVAHGETDRLTWILTRRSRGHHLLTLSDPRLRTVVQQCAEILRALHNWSMPDPVRVMYLNHSRVDQTNPDLLVGYDLIPLPLSRALTMAERLRTIPFIDPALVDEVTTRMKDLAEYDDLTPVGTCLIHGDAILNNILVDNTGRITAMLDFEWARLGPPHLELVSWLLSVSRKGNSQGTPPVLSWFSRDYRELFEQPKMRERLWLYSLAYVVRQVTAWPPDGPESQMYGLHPLPLLRRLASAPFPLHCSPEFAR